MKDIVLPIDDDQAILESLADYLKLVDFSVPTAKNGREGFERMERLNPDIIVFEIMMPGMDG